MLLIKGGQKEPPVIQMSYLIEHFSFRLEIERQASLVLLESELIILAFSMSIVYG